MENNQRERRAVWLDKIEMLKLGEIKEDLRPDLKGLKDTDVVHIALREWIKEQFQSVIISKQYRNKTAAELKAIEEFKNKEKESLNHPAVV